MLFQTQLVPFTVRLISLIVCATNHALGATVSLGAHNHALSYEVGFPSSDRATNDNSRKIVLTMKTTLLLGCLLVFSQQIEAQTQKKVAVILYNLSDRQLTFTTDQARATVFTDPNSVRAYYLESSWNQLDISGDVFGIYTVSIASSVCGANGASEAATLAAAAGYIQSNYFATIYLFPESACNYFAASFGSIIYVNSDILDMHNTGHELGHSLHMSHANSLICHDANGVQVPFSNNCTTNLYGDTAGGIMGAGINQLNNYNRGTLGLLSPFNTQTVTASGDYVLTPIEYQGGVSSLRIPTVQGGYYYFEFRQPSGVFDNYQPGDFRTQGISIRKGNDYIGSETFAIYSMSGFAANLIWPVGQTFTDPTYGISVTTTSISPEGATVHVAFDPAACVLQTPSMSITPSNQSAQAKSTLTYTVTVTNRNLAACPAQTYIVVPKLPSRWSQAPGSYTVTLGYGASDTRGLAITSPLSAKLGSYTVSEKANLSQKIYSQRNAVYSVIP